MVTIGYCVKCKAKQEMKNENPVEMKGKGGTVRKAMTGECPVCGTKMFKIMSKADADAAATAKA